MHDITRFRIWRLGRARLPQHPAPQGSGPDLSLSGHRRPGTSPSSPRTSPHYALPFGPPPNGANPFPRPGATRGGAYYHPQATGTPRENSSAPGPGSLPASHVALMLVHLARQVRLLVGLSVPHRKRPGPATITPPAPGLLLLWCRGPRVRSISNAGRTIESGGTRPPTGVQILIRNFRFGPSDPKLSLTPHIKGHIHPGGDGEATGCVPSAAS
jgi:hypothetical protein